MVMVRPPGAMASRTDPGAACERRETIRHVLRAVPCVLIVLALLPVARITYRPCRRRVARPRFIGLGERETLKSAVAPGSRSALRLFAAVDAGRCGSAGPRAGAYDHRLAQTLQETFQLGRRPFLGPHPVVKSPHPIIDSADSATQLTPNVMQLVAYPADVTAQLVPDAVQLAAYSATCSTARGAVALQYRARSARGLRVRRRAVGIALTAASTIDRQRASVTLAGSSAPSRRPGLLR